MFKAHSSNLKSRILTATLLLPIIIAIILLTPPKVFNFISAFVFLWGMWEWTDLAGFKTPLSRIGGLVLMPFITLLIFALLYTISKNLIKEYVPFLILAFWVSAIVALQQYPKNKEFWKSKIVALVTGCLVLVPAWGMLNALHYSSPKWVLYVLTLIWVADIAAYFVGKRFGKNQLAPLISPGKTWEGAIGALMTSLIVIVLGYRFLMPNIAPLPWLLLGMITVVFSVVGDLFESFYKRIRGVKDSGTILPGHGGILDRIDSITAAVPIFAVGFMFFA